MSLPEMSVEEAFKQLTNWTNALLYEIESCQTEIKSILGTTNGASFPTRRQQALLVFRQIKGKLTEVQGFVEIAENAIREAK
jgi:hypothetical protein